MLSRSGVIVVAVALCASLAVAPAHAAEQTFKTTNFALTWSSDGAGSPDTADADGDGVPDTVERMAAAFEQARTFMIDQLGYQAPPTKGRYPLYIGTTQRGFTRTTPGGEGRSRPSLTVIPQNLMLSGARNGEVKSFAVHEYFHAIQNGYDSGEDHWIKEASSAWIEGLFAPKARINQSYLYAYVPVPNEGLAGSGGLHEYGAFLFLQFLTERYSPTPDLAIVRELWEEMAVPEAIPGAPDLDSFGALESVLAKRGVTTSDSWGDFLLWRWQLQRFARGQEYRQALSDFQWQAAATRTVTTESCRSIPPTFNGWLEPFSAEYARFLPGEARSGLLTVGGPPGTTGFVIVKPSEGPPIISQLSFSQDGLATASLDFGDGARHVTLGFGPGTGLEYQIPFVYSLQLDGGSAVEATPPGAPSSTTYGLAAPLSGRVTCNGMSAPFARLTLTETEVATGSSRTISLVTDAFGNWSRTVAPQVNTTYEIEVTDPFLSSSSSIPTTVGVRVAMNITISDDQIDPDESLLVEGNVAPLHQETVVIDIRRVDGTWQTITETTTDANGDFSSGFTFPDTGVWEVRARMPETGDLDHLPGDTITLLVQVGQS